MSVAVKYPHIRKENGEPACLERTPRVRVSMIVMDWMLRGWSVEEICRQYPHVSLAEAHAAMAYYFDNRSEIDAEIHRELDELEHLKSDYKPSALVMRLLSLSANRK